MTARTPLITPTPRVPTVCVSSEPGIYLVLAVSFGDRSFPFMHGVLIVVLRAKQTTESSHATTVLNWASLRGSCSPAKTSVYDSPSAPTYVMIPEPWRQEVSHRISMWLSTPGTFAFFTSMNFCINPCVPQRNVSDEVWSCAHLWIERLDREMNLENSKIKYYFCLAK